MSDEPIAMAEMTILVQQMMSTVAKKHDTDRIDEKMALAVNGVRAEVALCAERLDGCDNRFDEMEARVMASEDRVRSAASRPPRSSTSSTRRGSSGVADADNWRPRLVNIRGWAPFGAGQEKKLSRRGRRATAPHHRHGPRRDARHQQMARAFLVQPHVDSRGVQP